MKEFTQKEKALIKYLMEYASYSEEEAHEEIENPSGDYAIYTDEEADEAVKDYIEESLWAFNSSFLANFLPSGCESEAETILKPLQEKCESGNDAIKALISWDENSSEIVEEAIRWDGRGHFLNNYDGEEYEIEVEGKYFYIYKQ